MHGKRGSCFSKKASRARGVYLEKRTNELGGGRGDIKTRGSSVCAIKYWQVFVECGPRETGRIPATMTQLFVLSVVLLGLIFPLRATGAPDFKRCQSNDACSVGYCCSIGPVRYSWAQCMPLLEEGATCRPGSAVTMNTTLGYPDGTLITLTDVHYILCPCADGLTCDREEGVCKDAGGKRDSNRLQGDHVDQDD